MRARVTLGSTLVGCLALLVASASAQTTLTGGRKLAFKVKTPSSKSTGTIGFVKDLASRFIPSVNPHGQKRF